MPDSTKSTDKPRHRSSYAMYRKGKASPEMQVTIYLVLVARRWRAMLDEHLREIEQTSARSETMSAILNSPPLSPQVDIARRMRIEGPTLTRMIDSLERDNLVERLADPNDRRSKQLRVTEEGEQMLDEIFTIADGLRSRLLKGFSEQRIKEFNEFCAELLKRLDEGLPG